VIRNDTVHWQGRRAVGGYSVVRDFELIAEISREKARTHLLTPASWNRL
jgi:hypothetical protein